MNGFQSPDVPAYITYLLVLAVGMAVARSSVNTLLDRYPDRWAFASTWTLFAAYTSLPLILFWFLDYTSIIHDTTLFAAIAVAVLYPQIFAGGVQGIVLPGQTAALWKPFEAWTKHVEDRISSRNERYRDRFVEDVRSRIAENPADIALLVSLVRERTSNLTTLDIDLNGLQVAIHQNVPGSERRLVQRLWDELRTAEPTNYGYLLWKKKLIPWLTYWRWLEKGQAKLVTVAVALVAVLLSSAGIYKWLAMREQRADLLIAYYQWRFERVGATDWDRFRSRDYLTRMLREKGERAREIFTPLVRDLKFKGTSPQQVKDTLGFIRDSHAPNLDRESIPLLIQTLRTESVDLRLHVQELLVDLARHDFERPPSTDKLLGWTPSEKDSSSQIEDFIQLWLDWWNSATAPPAGREKPVEDELKKIGRSVLPGIFFDFGKATIKPESKGALTEIAGVMADNPNWRAKVEGYTDDLGPEAYNLKLSQRRAEAVERALEKDFKVLANRLSAQGFGPSAPKAANDTEEGRAKNRRVELVRLEEIARGTDAKRP